MSLSVSENTGIIYTLFSGGVDVSLCITIQTVSRPKKGLQCSTLRFDMAAAFRGVQWRTLKKRWWKHLSTAENRSLTPIFLLLISCYFSHFWNIWEQLIWKVFLLNLCFTLFGRVPVCFRFYLKKEWHIWSASTIWY